MSAEPGWYHAQGDPEGTVRLWNGSEWVGFPQRDPKIPVGEAKKVVGPAHRQQRLAPFGWLARIGLLAPAAAYLFQAYVFVLLALELPGLDPESFQSVAAAEQAIEELAWIIELSFYALVAVGIAVLVSGVPFVLWFFVAYQNVGRWARTRYESWWAIVVWFVPFMNLRRPSHIMQELCEKSPREDRIGAINPVVAWAWWLVFICTGFGIRALGMWMTRTGDLVTAQIVTWIAVGLCLANVVAAVLAMRLVQQISHHQDLRFERVAVSTGTVELARV